MFKYISDIISKISMKQRITALAMVLIAIVIIIVGPKTVSALTQDNEELKAKVELQRSEINSLNNRVAELNNQLIESQTFCTNRFAKREQEFLIMISSLEAEAQRTNGQTVVLQERRVEKMGMESSDASRGDDKVAAVPSPKPNKTEIYTKTVIKNDNTKILNMIEGMKKDIKKNKN